MRTNVDAQFKPDESNASKFEANCVHDVYDNIAEDFSTSRYKPWPGVMNFLRNLADFSFGADFGCGNGKYLLAVEKESERPDFPTLMPIAASDVSQNLAKIVRNRGFDVAVVDILNLPYKNSLFDFFLSIAVIHHFCTYERRILALKNMIQTLRKGGLGLIQVWAKDQYKDTSAAKYIKNKKDNQDQQESYLETVNGHKLPIHIGGTNFKHSDVLVPFKSKYQNDEKDPLKTARYYHLFNEGELESLILSIPDVKIVNSFYEQGNWSVIVERI